MKINFKKPQIIILIISVFLGTSTHSQWRYPNYQEIKNDIVITYKVEYENELSDAQKESSRFKKEIIVFFNQNKLIEKTTKNTVGYETYYLYDYDKEKIYSCYKSQVKKEAIVRDSLIPKKKPTKTTNIPKKLLGFNTDVYTIPLGEATKEIITTKDIGLRYNKFFDVEGFLLKYSSKDKKLGNYTVTATKIDYTTLPEETYSLKGFLIRTDEEHKKYTSDRNIKREKIKEKSVNKINTKVPSYSLKTISGKKYKSNKQNGKIIVFTFMYLNSDASRKQIPQLNKLKDTFKNKDVEFIAAFLDPEYKIKKFLKTFPFNYEITDDASWLAKKFDVDLFPTNVIIDAKGKYQYYKTSYKSDMFESLSFSVEKLLNDE